MAIPLGELPEPELCRVCQKPKADHVPGVVIHSFVGQHDTASLSVNEVIAPPPDAPGNRQGRTGTLPTDPVLRLVLIRKGVLQVSDLEEVEAELRATGVATYIPSPHNG